MTIRIYAGTVPEIANSAYVDESAIVIGDVKIGEDSSIWPMTVVRGDVHSIRIGKCTNIQDACVLHVTHDGKFSPGGFPLVVGDHVTVGHRVTLHACTVGNYCLIGMSATIMDGAVLGDRLIIGAGSLVPTGKVLEGGFLYVGSPVNRIRELNETELEYLEYSASHYVKMKNHHKNPERLG
jgi:carbonic anhydrase/acetyltransferase-like protein (isoleucine patch superfamily)